MIEPKIVYNFSGVGQLFWSDRDKDGNPVEFIQLGRIDELKVLAIDTSKHHFRDLALDASISTQQRYEVSVSFSTLDLVALAFIFKGMVTTLPPTTTIETVIAKPGSFVGLNTMNISSYEVRSVDDSIIYVDGVNYTLDTESGMIQILSNQELAVNPIVGGQRLKVGYVSESYRELKNIAKQAEFWLRVVGQNVAQNNAPIVLDLFKVVGNLGSSLSVISPSKTPVSWKGTVVVDDKQGRFNYLRLRTV